MDNQDLTLERRLKAKDKLITELRDVVKDCVNFLADLNTLLTPDAPGIAQRARSLHKRAYTVHSKTKGE